MQRGSKGAVALLLACVFLHHASAERGFLLTCPSQLQVGQTERMCITFHGFDDPDEMFQMDISFVDKEKSASEIIDRKVVDIRDIASNGWIHCFDYYIPEEPFEEYGTTGRFTIVVRGRARNADYSFEEEKEIYVNRPSFITFIQTDKPKYKPGQAVKLRVLTVNDRLLPQLDAMHTITMKDPNDVTIMQWQNVSVIETQGIADLQLQLSDEPVLGSWVIEVVNAAGQKDSGYFAVEEYVLPKYEITVNTKSYVTVNDQKIDGEICAMYTYGEPVRGVMKAQFCIKASWGKQRPCFNISDIEVEGCHPFSVQTSDLELTNADYTIYDNNLEIFAEITETATDVVLNHTYSGTRVTQQVFNLEFLDSSPNYFKPGLPYYGRLKVERPDGSPAPGESVSVEFHDYQHNKHFTKVTTSDSRGLVSFSLPPIDIEITSISLQASMPDYPTRHRSRVHTLQAPSAHFALKQWYSPTNSYIQIQPKEDTLACDSEVLFNISHTVEDAGQVAVYYQVVSRGNLLENGQHLHEFGEGVLVRPDDAFEEQRCPDDMSFSTCVPRETTCEEALNSYRGIGYRHTGCQRGCYCRWPQHVSHDGRCITPSQCPGYAEEIVDEPPRPSCPRDQFWKDCASACVQTCDDPPTPMACIAMCAPRCECRPDKPVLHEGECITRRECPGQERPDRSTVRRIVSFPLRMRIQASMSPDMKLLVYYVREDGETIADSTTVSVAQCTQNKVEIAFADQEKYPGETTTLRIRADPESLCSVGVVDKSVHVLGGKNRLTLSQVMTELEQYKLGEHSFVEDENDYCRRQLENNNRREDQRKQRNRDALRRRGFRQRRSIIYPGRYLSDYYDSMKAFRKSGMLAIADTILESRPCEESYIYPRFLELEDDVLAVPAIGLPGPDIDYDDALVVDSPIDEFQSNDAPKPTLDIRTYFPETWLWDLHLVGLSGEKEIIQELPHTVTSWVGGGFCTNLETGIGVSEPTTIKGFQPFFVSLTLPYSVIRNEVINLPVTVFNYLTECLNVQLTIDESEQLDMDGQTTIETCVCGQETSTQYFRISPNTLGDVNVTIRAETVDNNGVCGNRIFATDQIGVRDAVVRPLLVEAEGEPQEYSRTSFICPEPGVMYTEDMVLELPDNVVPDTPKATVKVIGDLLGPALDDIDNLLAMPYGCGEQNMLRFAPNIFVMQYLESVNEVTPEIERKSKEFLQAGYQRELTYRHHDGAYSAFGNNDREGSMWLTAFVLKSFAQAKPLMFIDKENLQTSIDWVLDKQLENGCFPKVGTVHHKDMKGGLDGNNENPVALTAYVLISMLEAKQYVSIPQEAIDEAFFCMESYTTTSVYTLALTAYAYSLYDVTSEARARVMETMEERAQISGDLKYWSSGYVPPPNRYYGDNSAKAVDIETTAYMLLAYTAPGAEDPVGKGLPIVYWLSKQRSSGGGFSSTQDTSLALQSLARYAASAYSDTMEMQVMVRGEGMERMFMVDNNNKMIMQKETVVMPNTLRLEVTGTGCAFVQTSVKYNVMEIPVPEPAFALSADVRTVRSTDGCKRRELRVCARYLLEDEASKMAIIGVKMVSGWIPDKDTIKNLMNRVDLDLKRYEVEPNSVNFYFDEITSERLCLEFHVVMNVEVDEAKPGYVEVYDYYELENRVTKPYEIRDICGTKEELPHLTEQEYNEIVEGDMENPDEIEQRRVPARLPFENEGDEREPVIEDIIVPEVAIPLGHGDHGGSMNCPHCYDETPADFSQRLCAAAHAYKAAVRHGRFQAKLMSDLRTTETKTRMEHFTNFAMQEGCRCHTISDAETNAKILILQSGGRAFNEDEQSLVLDNTSHVVPYPIAAGLISRTAVRNCQP